MEESAPRFMEAVIGAVSGTTPLPVCASARDARRVGDALRYIERHAADALDIETLAGVAIMSKYHFLRTFRHIVGMTPYQFVLSVRMRRVAVRLATSSEPVSAIAFETGFGDLSTFNGRFPGRVRHEPDGLPEPRARTVTLSAPQPSRGRRGVNRPRVQ